MEFAEGPAVMRSRVVNDLPAAELILGNRRVSLAYGSSASLADARRFITDVFGLAPRAPLEMDVVMSTNQPFGWRRSTTTMTITVVKPGSQVR